MDYGGLLTIGQFYKSYRGHVGGTLWNSFDHQRGYHPDPFWGGIMDMFRQSKYPYYMMMSQRNPSVLLAMADSGPMLYIANAMTSFSSEDIVVYSNCDSVRVIVNGKDTLMQVPILEEKVIRYPPVIFKMLIVLLMSVRFTGPVSRWGTAPALIRTTGKTGKIKVKARLLHPRIQLHL